MRIGLAYNQKPDAESPPDEPGSSTDAYAEWDEPSTIDAVEQALGLFGTVIRLHADTGACAARVQHGGRSARS